MIRSPTKQKEFSESKITESKFLRFKASYRKKDRELFHLTQILVSIKLDAAT